MTFSGEFLPASRLQLLNYLKDIYGSSAVDALNDSIIAFGAYWFTRGIYYSYRQYRLEHE